MVFITEHLPVFRPRRRLNRGHFEEGQSLISPTNPFAQSRQRSWIAFSGVNFFLHTFVFLLDYYLLVFSESVLYTEKYTKRLRERFGVEKKRPQNS